MVTWSELIGRRNKWVAYNFPDGKDTPATSVLGCIEEVGELAHAHLKEFQNIRGDAAVHQAAAQDSIGDLAVYLMGVMQDRSWTRPTMSFGVIVLSSEDALLCLAGGVGTLANIQRAGSTSASQWHEAIDRILHYARRYCELREWDFDAIVTETWNEVEKRDWIEYPDSGLPPAVKVGD